MNRKDLIIFSLGTLFGAGVTYLALNKKYDKQYQKDREDLREIYQRKSKESLVKSENKSAVYPITNHDIDREKIINKLNSLANGDDREPVDYTNLYGGHDLNDDTYMEINNIEQKLSIVEHPQDDDEVKPYIITEEEFSEPIPPYEKVTLEYFVLNDILIDSMSHELVDVSSTCGEDVLQVLPQLNDYCIYVRNEANSTDYEIELNQEDYNEVEKGFIGTY